MSLNRGEQIKKMWYIYTMEYYLAMKKNDVMPFAATWIQQEIIILSEVSQKLTNTIYYITYMWDLKCDTNKPIQEIETDSWTQRTDLCLSRCGDGKGKGWAGSQGLVDANYYIYNG